MVKHVVLWRFEKSDPGTFENTVSEVTGILNGLTELISDLNSLEVGRNINKGEAAYDLVLITTHKNEEALNNYQKHPDHIIAAGRIGQLAIERAVVDFEY